MINSNRFKHPWPVMPFGLCCVAAALKDSERHSVHLLDLCFSTDCERDIKETLESFVPDVIGISIRNIDDTGGYDVYFLLEDVKNDVVDPVKKNFTGPVVIGGPSVGISGREMLEYFDLEYAIRGDGEGAIVEFVDRIENCRSLEGLKGLIIRKDKAIIQETEPSREDNLDALPFPQPKRYLDIDRYRKYGSPLLVQTKRGCALSCSYCTYNRIEGHKYRLISPRLIADRIETLVKETGFNHIEFADSIFNVPLYHAKAVLREIISKNLNIKLHTMGLSPAAMDDELLNLMKNAGFNEVDIGAESACDDILQSLSKNFKRSDIIQTAALLRKKKIPVTWFIMLGAPVETRETVLETLNTIGSIASKWDLVFISTGVRVYNGAPLANEILKLDQNCTADNFLHPVKIEPAGIALTEIHEIVKHFSRRFPNFYLYEKENIIPGWLLVVGNTILKVFRSRQPVWRLLIFLKRIKRIYD